MMDFNDVRAATKDQQIRAYSVERTLDLVNANGNGASGQDLVNISKMVEDYITNGDLTSSISSAVKEGYNEGRFEVKEAVEKMTGLDLNDLFAAKGWLYDANESED